MSLAKIYSRALNGLVAPEVIVEVHVASGLPSFTIVGLADTEIKESRERVRSAIQMSGYAFPARRITVNLAPADLPKDSSRYDLPIAIGILLASNLITPKVNLQALEFAGELALDGELRPVKGALALAYGITQQSRHFILPLANAEEAALVQNICALGANHLGQVIAHINGSVSLARLAQTTAAFSPSSSDYPDMNQVKGQAMAKKALEIAAAGRHSALLIGNPGCGKSMLAMRLISLLPELSDDQAMVTASLHSLSTGGFKVENWRKVPFRSPHHSSSRLALIGGGARPQPGEISLAHNGVLFLDEVAEFEHKVLEVLREPLEAKRILLARAKYKVEYLADFQLIAAMNPCPCGNLGHFRKTCLCSVEQINRYRAKISGPLLDRMDIVVEVPLVPTSELQALAPGEDSATIRQRVIAARGIQVLRQNKLNSELSNAEIENYAALETDGQQLIQRIVDSQGLSARSYYRLLKLARTIADLEQTAIITKNQIALAHQFKRSL